MYLLDSISTFKRPSKIDYSFSGPAGYNFLIKNCTIALKFKRFEAKTMGWLERWKEQPKDSQMDLFGENEALVQQQRLTGAISNNLLKEEIEQRGGGRETQAAVNSIVTIEMLGCTPKQLYKETGGKPGKRDTLPLEAQEALQTGDIAVRHEIVGSDAQGDQQLKEAARRGSKRARKLFPW